MSKATEDLAERLAALEGSPRRKASRRNPSSVAAILGVGGILAIGGLGWAALQADTEAPMPTAAPEEFQTAGSDFGDIAPLLPVVAAPVPAPQATGSSPTELALMESLAALRAELDALRTEQSAPSVSGSDDAIAGLTAQIAALGQSATATQRDLERQLAERAREIEQMRMDLELARLEQPLSGLPGQSEEDLRLAELEGRRLAEAEALAARVASPMIAWSGMGAADTGAGSQNDQRLSADEAFVRTGAVATTVTRAEVIVNPSHTVIQGTMIQAVTETALDSSLPGAVRAIVSEDVHSYDGSRLLIPRGARLIGRYRSDAALAQSRVMIAWDRIILPDNQTVEISAYGGDELGRSGSAGFVDTRFAQSFGSAALISLIGALPAAAAGGIASETAADVASDIGSDLGDSTQGMVEDYLSIGPVIHVDQGTRITVMVDRDLEIF